MPSSRRWPRRMSWRTDRWRRRSGIWAWRSAERRRCRTPGARRRSCCSASSGCCWPASAATCRRWPRRHGGCRPLAEAPDAAQPGLGEELRALALISLGITEVWTARFEEAERHLEQGVALARRIGRPYLEFTGLAYLAAVEIFRSFARAAERSRQAIELAERHGWTDEPGRRHRLRDTRSRAGLAGTAGGGRALGPARRAHPQGRSRARDRTRGILPPRAARAGARPGRRRAGRVPGRRAAGRAARRPAPAVPRTRALLVHALVRLGETERAEQALAGLGEQDRERGETRIATAVLRLAQDDPHAAAAALAPVLDGVRLRYSRGSGWLTRSCWRRSPGTRSATRAPPAGPWSARWTWPSPTARCRRSCCTPRRACSSATPGTAPPTPP